MKTIHIITDHFAAGGIGVVIEYEAVLLAEQGYNVFIVCNSQGALSPDKWELMNPGILDRIQHPSIEMVIIDGSELKSYIDSLPLEDVLLLHTSWRGRKFSCFSYGDLSNRNFFVFVHNSSATENITMDQNLFNNLNLAKGIFYGSLFVLNDLSFLQIRSRLGLVPYGVDTDIFNSKGSKLFQSRSKRIIYIGRLLHEKGAHLLSSLSEFVKTEGLELLIHGKFRKSELDFDSSHILSTENAMNTNHMANMYRESAILLVPSLRGEGQPLNVLEAMACKTAVVATNFALGGISDKTFAFIAEPNSKSIVSSLKEAFDSPKKTEEKLQLGHKIVQQLSWRSHVNKLLNHIQSLGHFS